MTHHDNTYNLCDETDNPSWLRQLIAIDACLLKVKLKCTIVEVSTPSVNYKISREVLQYHAQSVSAHPMIDNLCRQQEQPRWWQGWPTILNDVMMKVSWWPIWQSWLSCDDPSNDTWLTYDNPTDNTWLHYDDITDKLEMTLIIKGWHLMISDDLPVYWVESCLSCSAVL